MFKVKNSPSNKSASSPDSQRASSGSDPASGSASSSPEKPQWLDKKSIFKPLANLPFDKVLHGGLLQDKALVYKPRPLRTEPTTQETYTPDELVDYLFRVMANPPKSQEPVDIAQWYEDINELISAGADLSKTYEGMYPLSMAAQNGNMIAIRFFLENKDPQLRLNPFIRQKDNGKSVMDAAASRGHLHVIEYILDFAVQTLGLKKHYPHLDELQIKKALLEMEGWDDGTVLHTACCFDYKDVTACLIEKYKVSLLKKDAQLYTPLASAIVYRPKKTYSVLEYLVMQKNMNVAENEFGIAQGPTPFLGLIGNSKVEVMHAFLASIRTLSIPLFERIISQLINTSNEQLRTLFNSSIARVEFYDRFRTREFRDSLCAAIKKAENNPEFHLKT